MEFPLWPRQPAAQFRAGGHAEASALPRHPAHRRQQRQCRAVLQRIAYYFSSVDALPLSDQYTDETAAATRSAQQLLGLEQTGIADADTWTAVEALSLQLAAHAPNPDRDTLPSTAYPGRAIAEGSAGQEVGQVERWLNRRAQLSCGEDYVADNNRFGAADAAAVRAVQQQAGLLVTGIVNRDTWAALQAQSCNCDKEE